MDLIHPASMLHSAVTLCWPESLLAGYLLDFE